jgi:hypothetical protein
MTEGERRIFLLILHRQFAYLGAGEDLAVLADQFGADVAVAAEAKAAVHAVFQGEIDLVIDPAHLFKRRHGEFDHDGRAADEGLAVFRRGCQPPGRQWWVQSRLVSRPKSFEWFSGNVFST